MCFGRAADRLEYFRIDSDCLKKKQEGNLFVYSMYYLNRKELNFLMKLTKDEELETEWTNKKGLMDFMNF